MRGVRKAGAVSAAVAVIGSVGTATPADASNYGVELNGTYRVTSNGDWAKTNDVFIDERTVIQTWTMSSSCTGPQRCDGQVTSDQGWTAPLRLGGGEGSPDAIGDFWVVDRVVDNWEPCPDGTAATGQQKLIFWGIDPLTNRREMTKVDLLSGIEKTRAPSGACGINKPLVIELPVRLDKLS
jgi:hypothetical protein